MDVPPTRPPGGERAWWFVAPPVRRDRDQWAVAAVRRRDAIRTAVGMVSALEFEWTTGPGGGVRLVARSPEEILWAESCWIPSYPGYFWRPASPPNDPADGPRSHWFGTLARPSSSTLPTDWERPWMEAVAPVLRGFPAGLRLRWRFCPGPLPRRIPPHPPTAERQPLGFRLPPLTEPEREIRDRQERRRHEPWWELRLVLDAPSSPRLDPTVVRFLRTLEAASARGGDNRLRFFRSLGLLRRVPPPIYLSEGEVGPTLPGPDTRSTAPSPVGAGGFEPGLAIGRDDAGVVVRLPIAVEEGRHLAILGETGMGKSSALLRLALEACRRGGVVVMDPVGDTGRAFLARLPRADRERTVWISPTQSPVAIDLLASLRRDRVGAVAADRALGDVVDALRRVRQSRFSETPFWGPRIEETMRRALAAAAAFPGGTLADAERLLGAVGQRPTGVPPEARAAIDELWVRARERPEEVEGSRRLLAELTGRPALVGMLGAARPRFAPSDLSGERAIVVITADAADIGEVAARYLLAVHLALFWTARLAVPRPPKTFLLLEEAQWYAHETVGEMLRLGRRTNLHVYLATQALGSLPETVAESVRTNAADFLVYRGSPEESREFARWTPEVDPVHLLSLPRGRALLLRGKGALVTPIGVDPVAAPSPDRHQEALESVRRASRVRCPGEFGVGDGTGPPPSRGGPLLPGAEKFRDLVLVLWAALLDAGDGASTRISLRRLRTASDPDGGRVREAGRWLRSTGIVDEAERDSEGAGWEVFRAGIAELLGSGVGSEELAEATRKWRASGVVIPAVPTQPS